MKLLKSKNFKMTLGSAAAVVLMYIVQFTPLMPSINGVYFSPLLILTLCFASHETDLHSMVFGMVCGMAVDINSLALTGFHAILYAILSVMVSLMCEFYFQRRMRTAIFLSIFPITANSFAQWLIGTKLCENAWHLYLNFYLPSAIYTFVMFIPIYAIFTVVFGYKNKYYQPKGVVPERLQAVRKKYAKRVSRGVKSEKKAVEKQMAKKIKSAN